MTKRPAAGQDAWFSGPFEPEEVRGLLAVVEERLRLRAAGDSSPPATDAAEPAVVEEGLDPAATFDGESLGSFAAPLFNLDKGGSLARAGKAILNLPLRILGRPQLYFNDALRRVVRSWSDVLAATLDNLAALQREVAAHRARLAALEAKLEDLARQVAEKDERRPS